MPMPMPLASPTLRTRIGNQSWPTIVSRVSPAVSATEAAQAPAMPIHTEPEK